LIIKDAKHGILTDEMKFIIEKENITKNQLCNNILEGSMVILKNTGHPIKPVGIGKGLQIKVNVNIGSSKTYCNPEEEVEKAKLAINFGTDTLMDLSSGKTLSDIVEIRRRILDICSIPLGTVPIYQTALSSLEKKGSIIDMDEDDMFNVIAEQAKEGVDFFTIHAGVTKKTVEMILKKPRKMGIVSRGGTFHASWILHHEKENPFFKNFDYILDLAQEYDFVISFGDGLRPGTVFDSTDYGQVEELITISKLVKIARERNVQVMVEGPGHLFLDQIEMNVKLQKQLCDQAPFYILGPLVTDIAAGYDEVAAAIGAAIAGMAGADFFCYLTPAEHLGLPTLEDVKRGLIASKIAAHAVNLIRRPDLTKKIDYDMMKARNDFNWKKQCELTFDPERARAIHDRVAFEDEEGCSMCGDLCAIRLLKNSFEKARKREN